MTEPFVKERVHTKTGKKQKVTIDDARAFRQIRQRVLTIFESTRYARGHKALYTFEINGADGSFFWDLHDPHRLEYFEYDKEDPKTRGYGSIHVSDNGGEHPHMDKWWVPGLNIGYEHSFINQFADFVKGYGSRKNYLCVPIFVMPWKPNTFVKRFLDSAKRVSLEESRQDQSIVDFQSLTLWKRSRSSGSLGETLYRCTLCCCPALLK